MKNLVILTGPTAVGKTDISIKLAKEINGEIISADSIQVYKGLDIGSAKISEDEMDGVKHYLIDVLDPTEEFDIYTFKTMSEKAIDEIYAKGKIPIIVGGTGFYIQSVLYDVDFEETEVNMEYRKELEELASEYGNEYVHKMLEEVDPDYASSIHPNNIKRVIRALEFYHENQTPLSKHNSEQRENESPYNFAYYVLNDDREVLYDRINKRVDLMFDEGLVDEVKGLKESGLDESNLSMQGIGYKEVLECLNNNISLEDCKELIKKNTRHFAKRQLTWFRRENTVQMIDYRDFDRDIDKVLDYMLKDLREKEIWKN
ncbi:MAG: tRNA (adenosine(37)-N6)-dimethylallyltransferase MiaA [Eubacterium sp.]|nr:tRNA (adenosine(37)-N6)-dimethylallyltransferase MiaA [Eubacterium sp.]